jgi:hypothetical protein
MSTVKGVVFAGELSDDEEPEIAADADSNAQQSTSLSGSATVKQIATVANVAITEVVATPNSISDMVSSYESATPNETGGMRRFAKLADAAHTELSAAIRALKEKVLPSRASANLRTLEQLSKQSAQRADETVHAFTALTNQLAALEHALCTMQATTAPDGKSTGAQYLLPNIRPPTN